MVSPFHAIRRQLFSAIVQFNESDVIVHLADGTTTKQIAASVGPIKGVSLDTPTGHAESNTREIKIRNDAVWSSLGGVVMPGWRGWFEIDGRHWVLDNVVASDDVGHHLTLVEIQIQDDSGAGRRVRTTERR